MKPASGKRMRAWAGTRFLDFQVANSGYSTSPAPAKHRLISASSADNQSTPRRCGHHPRRRPPRISPAAHGGQEGLTVVVRGASRFPLRHGSNRWEHDFQIRDRKTRVIPHLESLGRRDRGRRHPNAEAPWPRRDGASRRRGHSHRKAGAQADPQPPRA